MDDDARDAPDRPTTPSTSAPGTAGSPRGWRRLDARLSTAWARLEARWRTTLAVASTLVLATTLARLVAGHTPPPIGADSALFQHAGWYITEGAVPYVDIWDIKPPLVFETTTLLAVLAGGNPYALHALSLAVTVGAAAATVVLVGALTHRLTGSPTAALTAGALLLAFPAFHAIPPFGFRPKYLTLALGIGAILLALDDKPTASGAAAAAAAGYWQFGLIFALLTLPLAATRTGRRGALRHIGGMALVTAIVLAPILAAGAGEAMIVEVVLAPLLTPESQDLLFRGAKGILHLGYTLPAALLGAWGLARAIGDDPRPRWWLAALAAWVLLQLAVLDYDGYADLLLGVALAGIGLGWLVHTSPASTEGNASGTRRAVAVLLGVTLVTSTVALGGAGVLFHPVTVDGPDKRDDPALVHRSLQEIKYLLGRPRPDETAEANDTEPGADVPYGRDEMATLYWEQIRPTSCHYRNSAMEQVWIERLGRSYDDTRCGAWPSEILPRPW